MSGKNSNTRKSLRSFVFALLMIACAAMTAACAAIFGFEHLSSDGFEGSAGEGGTMESGTDAPPFEAGPQCTDLGIPDRPILDGGTDALDPIHMAVHIIDFGIDKRASAVGFNLDHACSPTVATSTCKTNIDEETFDKYAQDKNDKGLDNAGFGLLGYLSYLGTSFAPQSINDRLAAGEFGLVVRLVNWNGTPEDDDVFVEVFPAIGVLDIDAGNTPGGKPLFDSTDQWLRDRRYQQFNDFSTIKSANGWVTGGVLVASFQSITFGMSVPDDPKPIDVVINEGFITGKLSPDGASWKIDEGILGGRWVTQEFLNQIRTIYIKDTAGLKNVVLCDPNLPVNIYNLVKKEVCDGRDIRGASREDSTGQPCNAISAGIKISTYAVAAPGPFSDLPAIAARCQKDGSIPATDDCAPAFP